MRIHWIDNAKAISILLVVLGHTKGLDAFAYQYIYSFHMPLFFFLSGYLLGRYHFENSLANFIKFQFKKLIVQYLVFWIISYVYWLPASLISKQLSYSKHLNFYDPFIGILYGTANYLYPNVDLWFFTCLFTTSIFFFIIQQSFGKYKWLSFLLILIAGLVFAYIYNEPKIRLPWNIDTSIVALIFFSLGFRLKESDIINKTFLISYKLNIIGFILLSVILFFVVKINGNVNMSQMSYDNPLLFLVTSLIGISSILFISNTIPQNKCCEWLSKNTIVIFPLHAIFFSIFTGIGVKLFRLPYNFKEQFYFIILYVLASIVLCIPVSFLFRKYAPALIGFKRPLIQGNLL